MRAIKPEDRVIPKHLIKMAQELGAASDLIGWLLEEPRTYRELCSLSTRWSMWAVDKLCGSEAVKRNKAAIAKANDASEKAISEACQLCNEATHMAAEAYRKVIIRSMKARKNAVIRADCIALMTIENGTKYGR